MGNQVFRQESLEQLSNVKVSRDYLHAPTPRWWMILSCVMVLVIGFVLYTVARTHANTIQTTAAVATVTDSEGNSGALIQMSVPDNVTSVVKVGTRVMIGTYPGTIQAVSTYEDGETVATVFTDDENPPDGAYDASIILDDISLLEFLSS